MELVPGDVVALKSGGPVMTVARASGEAHMGMPAAVCCWFDEGDALQTATVPIACLVRPEPAIADDEDDQDGEGGP